jgi:hypothetical protein
MDISKDGTTMVTRTDTYGGYIWDFTANRWRQILTTQSMPPADCGLDMGQGIYEGSGAARKN